MSGRSKVIIITGASSGIGRATALRAADHEDHLVLVARGAGALEDVARECRASGAASVMVLPCDVGDDSAVAACFEKALTAHSVIDAVVHAAGVVAYGRTEEIPPDVFDGVLRTNLTGSVNVARHAVSTFRTQRAGTLVLIGSVIGHISVPSMSPYVLSKWGIRALARQLLVENRDMPGVHIAYVAPGGVDTPIYEQAANYDGHIGRPPPPIATPEKVARIALRLLERPRARSQVNLSNEVIRLGFSVLPGIFDMLVGPLFRLAAIDGTSPIEPHRGNVLASHEAGNKLHGGQRGALAGIARNALARVRVAASGSAK